MKNPPWTRDELLLTLDFYLASRNQPPTHAGSPGVQELSDVLNRLAAATGVAGDEKFRNANGVLMKLMNFRRFDPAFTGAGLTRGGKQEEVIWERFSNRPGELRKIASAITANLQASEDKPLTFFSELSEAEEGALLTRVHVARERSRKIVARKKADVVARGGRLCCEVCGFDFRAAYGERGEGFIECHHTKPISSLRPGDRTRLDDLALVCSNCHRMIHRSRPWLAIEELRNALTSI